MSLMGLGLGQQHGGYCNMCGSYSCYHLMISVVGTTASSLVTVVTPSEPQTNKKLLLLRRAI